MSGDVELDLYIKDFAEMVRDLIRAVAADDSSGAVSHASQRIERLFAHAGNLPSDLNWNLIIESSVDLLKPSYSNRSSYENDYNDLASLGAKLLAELTTSDGLSVARINKARQAVESEIKFIDARRELRRSGLTI